MTENILLKCQREPEEKKIKYIANMLASFSFNSQYTVTLAHQMVKTAELLTYRQLVILKLAVIKDVFNLREEDYRGGYSFTPEHIELLHEIHDMYFKGLIHFNPDALLGQTDIKPKNLQLSPLGANLYNAMSLQQIPNFEVSNIAKNLQ